MSSPFEMTADEQNWGKKALIEKNAPTENEETFDGFSIISINKPLQYMAGLTIIVIF